MPTPAATLAQGSTLFRSFMESTTDSSLSPLPTADFRRLRGWVVAFARSWEPGLLERFAGDVLSQSDAPLRAAALLELACVDMRRRWQAGDQRTVADYLAAHPELVPNPPIDLIIAEHDSRQNAG